MEIDTTGCVTCSQQPGSHILLIQCDKTVNKTISEVLRKHFWFTEFDLQRAVICQNCWEQVTTFHRFYVAAEELHQNRLVSLVVKSEPEVEQVYLEEEEPKLFEDKNELPEANNDATESAQWNDDEDVSDDEHSNDQTDRTDSAETPTILVKLRKSKNEEQRQLDDDYIRQHVKYICKECGLESNTFTLFTRHSLDAHANRSPFLECCGKKFYTKTRLLNHVQVVNDPDVFRCKKCQKTFLTNQGHGAGSTCTAEVKDLLSSLGATATEVDNQLVLALTPTIDLDEEERSSAEQPATSRIVVPNTVSPVQLFSSVGMDATMNSMFLTPEELQRTFMMEMDPMVRSKPSHSMKDPQSSRSKMYTDSPSKVADSGVEFTTETLRSMLQNLSSGRDILALAEKGTLSERRQLELAEIVAVWHTENRNKLYESDVRKYAQSIVKLFRYEKEEFYFLPKGGDKKNPGGKIYNKIVNLRSKSRKRRAEDEEHEKLQNVKSRNVCERLVYTDTIREALRWLLTSGAPTDSTWSTVVDKWRASFPVRVGYLGKPNATEELVKANLWRYVSSQYGHQLLDIDYELLNLDIGYNNLEWPHILSSIGEYMKQRAIDGPSMQLLYILNDNSATEDTRMCALLLLLNFILVPSKVSIGYKPTIVEGQDDTVVFADSEDHARVKLTALDQRYRELAMPVSPKLVFFGCRTKLAGVFRVYFRECCYDVHSVQRAIDVYIKLTAVLALKHSKISKLIWLFISRYVYKLPILENYAGLAKLEAFLVATKLRAGAPSGGH